jgi:hypothetical protein
MIARLALFAIVLAVGVASAWELQGGPTPTPTPTPSPTPTPTPDAPSDASRFAGSLPAVYQNIDGPFVNAMALALSESATRFFFESSSIVDDGHGNRTFFVFYILPPPLNAVHAVPTSTLAGQLLSQMTSSKSAFVGNLAGSGITWNTNVAPTVTTVTAVHCGTDAQTWFIACNASTGASSTGSATGISSSATVTGTAGGSIGASTPSATGTAGGSIGASTPSATASTPSATGTASGSIGASTPSATAFTGGSIGTSTPSATASTGGSVGISTLSATASGKGTLGSPSSSATAIDKGGVSTVSATASDKGSTTPTGTATATATATATGTSTSASSVVDAVRVVLVFDGSQLFLNTYHDIFFSVLSTSLGVATTRFHFEIAAEAQQVTYVAFWLVPDTVPETIPTPPMLRDILRSQLSAGASGQLYAALLNTDHLVLIVPVQPIISTISVRACSSGTWVEAAAVCPAFVTATATASATGTNAPANATSRPTPATTTDVAIYLTVSVQSSYDDATTRKLFLNATATALGVPYARIRITAVVVGADGASTTVRLQTVATLHITFAVLPTFGEAGPSAEDLAGDFVVQWANVTSNLCGVVGASGLAANSDAGILTVSEVMVQYCVDSSTNVQYWLEDCSQVPGNNPHGTDMPVDHSGDATTKALATTVATTVVLVFVLGGVIGLVVATHLGYLGQDRKRMLDACCQCKWRAPNVPAKLEMTRPDPMRAVDTSAYMDRA